MGSGVTAQFVVKSGGGDGVRDQMSVIILEVSTVFGLDKSIQTNRISLHELWDCKFTHTNLRSFHLMGWREDLEPAILASNSTVRYLVPTSLMRPYSPFKGPRLTMTWRSTRGWTGSLFGKEGP